MTNQLWTAALITSLLLGCAEDLKTSGGDGEAGAPITHVEHADGTRTTTVNATSEEAWLYLDLDTGQTLEEGAPGWDVAFQRYRIKSNGGISGDGGVQVAARWFQAFEDVTEAPAKGYVVDAEDSDDEDVDPDFAFLGPDPWYLYGEGHIVSPADVTYVVQTTEMGWVKVRMLAYYNDVGSAGYPKFQWGPVDPPQASGPQDGIAIEAPEEGQWVYVDLDREVVLAGSGHRLSPDWDIAVAGTVIRTNSGPSGKGVGGAQRVEGVWEDITTSPTVGFVQDVELTPPAPATEGTSASPVLAGWFEYDPEAARVTPKDDIYLVRTGDGQYVKLQFLAHEAGVTTVRTSVVERAAQVHTATVSTEGDGFAYFSLTAAGPVEVADPTDDLSWDLGLSSHLIRTNSGTSGDGDGGARDPQVASLAELPGLTETEGCYLISEGHICDCEVTEAACAEREGIWAEQCACGPPFVADEMISVPDAEAQMASASPVLSTWYGDAAEAPLIPRAAAFLVLTAAGDLAKIQITDAADGALTFQWVYAGPEQTTF